MLFIHWEHLKLLKGEGWGRREELFQTDHSDCHEVGLQGTLNTVSLKGSVLQSVTAPWLSPSPLTPTHSGCGMHLGIRYNEEDSLHGVYISGGREVMGYREECPGCLIPVSIGG